MDIMNIKYEIKNMIDRYGKRAVIEAFADFLNDEACHFSDRGDNDSREVFDDAYDAVMLCIEDNA